jgi:hypothetical protein
MKIRLYFDEDAMDADLVHALRIRGVDVTSALEEGMIRRSDADHLELPLYTVVFCILSMWVTFKVYTPSILRRASTTQESFLVNSSDIAWENKCAGC